MDQASTASTVAFPKIKPHHTTISKADVIFILSINATMIPSKDIFTLVKNHRYLHLSWCIWLHEDLAMIIIDKCIYVIQALIFS